MSSYIKTGDTVRFGVVTHNPSGGALVDADETPRWYVYENNSDTAIQEGEFTKRTGLIGSYRASITPSGGWIYDSNSYYEIHASGKVNGLQGRSIIKSFVLDDVYDANLVQISGSESSVNNYFSDLYYADIKFNKDVSGIDDEYSVTWFKNSSLLSSGDVDNPSVSVYNSTDGSSVFANQTLDFVGTQGFLNHTHSTTSEILNSGEAYMVVTSGLIDGSNREWRKVVGIDYLYEG